MKKVIGIVSWLPDNEEARTQRIDRLERLFKQLDTYFKDIQIMIIAQNWKDYTIPNFVKHASIFRYDRLGILNARKTLREKFLESDYDYLIMCDDDCIIESTVDATKNYLNEIDKHPQGFCFIQYDYAQLNLCAISRYIYEVEPMVDIDPQKNEGFEDLIWSTLLHYKYPNLEFHIEGIKHIQFNNPNESAPSTWANEEHRDWQMLLNRCNVYIEQFKHGDFSLNKLPKITDEILRKKEWYETAIWQGWCTREEYNEFKKKYGL